MVGSRDKVFSSTAEGDPPREDVRPAVDPVDLKRRRRVASRTLLSSQRAVTPRQAQIKAESEALAQAVAAGAFSEEVCSPSW
eukprot:COSAG05_NODE_323_length_11408_cov_361.826156_10_plen_82_part_00